MKRTLVDPTVIYKRNVASKTPDNFYGKQLWCKHCERIVDDVRRNSEGTYFVSCHGSHQIIPLAKVMRSKVVYCFVPETKESAE